MNTNRPYTKIVSNISRSKLTGTIFVGTDLMARVTNVTFVRGHLGQRKMLLQSVNTHWYEVVQADRGEFELRGKYLEKGIFCEGWADAVRVLNSL